MTKTFAGTFSRRGPDVITEELTAMLSEKTSFEFKPLFKILHAALHARSSAHGGEEMLHLRVYEKLQALVDQGVVTKNITTMGKTYRGIPTPLRVLISQMKILRDEWTQRIAAAPIVAGS